MTAYSYSVLCEIHHKKYFYTTISQLFIFQKQKTNAMFRILLLLLTLTTFQVVAQDDDNNDGGEEREKVPLGERLYYSGGLGFNAGRANGVDFITLSISPNVGYKFNEIFSIGAGGSYQWFRFRNPNFSTNNLGWKAFTRGKLPANILLAAEYESVSFDLGDGSREWRRAALAGIGYHLPQNDVVSLNFFLYYNLSFGNRDALYFDQLVPRVEIAYNF